MTAVGAKASGIVTVVAEPVDPENDEITSIWQEVQVMVVRMAGGDPSKIDKQLDIDGVMRHLEQVQASDQKAAEKHGQVKKAFNRTLQFISKVGGMIADGASNAFGPANTCFNALTFVIAAWQSYSAAFESLAELLEKCAQFFERLTYYKAMDASLRKVISCQFKLFINVCDKALQLKKKRHKVTMFLKHMFLDDDDIKGLLAAMENLTAREHGLVSAQTFKISQDAAKASQEAAQTTKESSVKLDTLVEQNATQRQEKAEQKFKDKVQEAFFGKNSKDAIEKWESPLRKHKADLIDGTGQWLNDEPLFTSWMTGDDNTDPILGIEGEKGSGKSRIATHIINRLQKQKTVDGSSTRSVCAYYFQEADSKEDANQGFRKKHVIAGRISKSLLWQLTQQERPFLRSVAGLCVTVKLDDPVHVWKQFLLENGDRSNIESTFFIVLDGLGENLDGLTTLFQKLSEDSPRLRTRVLVTGTKSTFEQLESEDGIRMKKITLGTRNKKDMELYIDARMNDMEILKDLSRPDVPETRKMVLEKLLDSANGDYDVASTTLDKIDRVDSLEEVKDCLEKAGETRSKQILEEFKRLDDIMKPKEIEEINEVILWVKWGLEWMTPQQVEAALELKADPESATRQTSLRSLESKIRTKYSPLFRMDDDTIDFKVDEMWEDQNIPGPKNPESILPEELYIVKHYLTTVCPKDVYDKFGFKDFFERKMERKQNHICQDSNNAQITLALRCLRCLVDPQTEKSQKLLTYSAEYLYQHLEKTDLSLSNRDLKVEAGALLSRLFVEEAAITALISRSYGNNWEIQSACETKSLPSNWGPWIFNDSGNKLLQKWSEDSTVLEHLEDKNALKNVASGENNWYRKAARITTKKLFDRVDRGRVMQDHFTLLTGLIKRLTQSTEETTKEFSIDEDKLWRPTLDDFDMVEAWTYENFGKDEISDAVWQEVMMDILYWIEDGELVSFKDVEARARRTLELHPDHWVAMSYMGVIRDSADQIDESITMLEKVIEQLKDVKNDPEWRSARSNLGTYTNVIINLGHLYWEKSDEASTEKAAKLYLAAIDESHFFIESFAIIIVSYFAKRSLWGHIVAYCEKLVGTTTKNGTTVAAEVVQHASKNYGYWFWNDLLTTCLETDRWDILENLWKEGVKKSESPTREPYWIAHMNKWYKWCLAHRPGYKNAGISAIESVLREEWVQDWDAEILNEFAAFLLPAYTKRAFKEDSTPEARAIGIEKVKTLDAIFRSGLIRGFDSSLRFARFSRLNGDIMTGKRLLRDTTAQMLEMLSDDDVENDWNSFRVLAQIFTAMNDEANRQACWEMMSYSRQAEMKEYERKLKAWQDSTASTSRPSDENGPAEEVIIATGQPAEEALTTPESDTTTHSDPIPEHVEAVADGNETTKTEEETSGNEEPEASAKDDATAEKSADAPLQKPELPVKWICYCRGGCNSYPEIPDRIWVCEDCVGHVYVDDACYIKDGPKAVRDLHCTGDHKFFQLPQCDEAWIKDIPMGNIRVGGKFIPMEEWKADVKANYVDCVEAVTPEDTDIAE
ncbi:neutral amino acid permease [Colletotrichum karsti]|uniref:Neutral amino acid permease n=1 Tax=Colletotrichum karsti TaxID=1095194 RepID=A0A9P6IDV6_9PEZI|nr:neutral amino acid permease [Colletotrichum karsti]KAF9880552.1 neutral amino acid permease [Colletotrichum karsti]